MFKFVGSALGWLGEKFGLLAGKADENPKTRDGLTGVAALLAAWWGIDAAQVNGAVGAVCGAANKFLGLF